MSLYDEICAVLQVGHGKGEGPDETINRVFQKNYERGGGADEYGLPVITRFNVLVSLEIWPTDRLMRLLTRITQHAPGSVKGIGKKARHFPDTPVVVARFKGRDYLMDGNRRVQHLNELGRETMQVYVCHLR